MRSPTFALNRFLTAISCLALAVLTVSPCYGVTLETGSRQPSRAVPSKKNPIQYYYTVLPQIDSENTYVNGINDEIKVTTSDHTAIITGTYGSTNQYNGFQGKCTTPNNASTDQFSCNPFQTLDSAYPDTLLQGLSNGDLMQAYDVGYAMLSSCGSSYCPESGLVYNPRNANTSNHGWTTITDPNQGAYSCAVTQVLGINGSRMGVGFYEKNAANGCAQQPFEFYQINGQGQYYYVDLTPPPSVNGEPVTGATANGIDDSGDVAGTLTTFGGQTYGWYYSELGYYVFSIANDATAALGINVDSGIVGDYIDGPNTYGYVISEPENPMPNYTTLPCCNSSSVTVATAVNKAWDISGYYVSGGQTFGFLAACNPCPFANSDRSSRKPSRNPKPSLPMSAHTRPPALNVIRP